MMLKFYGFLIRWAYKMLCVCLQYSTAQTYLDCHKDKNQVWWSGKIEGTPNKRLNSRTNPPIRYTVYENNVLIQH